MSAIADDEVVERVAEAIYLNVSQAIPPSSRWARATRGTQELYRDCARAAIKAHYEAYETSYVDAEHQGGNLLDFVIQVSARAYRAEEELGAVRAFCVEKAGEYLPEDTTPLKAVELLQNATAGWKALAKTYGDEIVALREELIEARDMARVNDFKMLQGQYTRAAADLAEERQKNMNLHIELSRRQRQGQAAMNVLGIVRSDLYSSASGTEIDPFHQDQRLDKFFDWLRTAITLEERVAKDRGARHELKDVAEELGVDLEEVHRDSRKDADLRPATFDEVTAVLKEFSDAMDDAEPDDGHPVIKSIQILNRHLSHAHHTGNALASVEAIRAKVGLCTGGMGIWARYCEGDCSNG